jgi:hypothetical protein
VRYKIWPSCEKVGINSNLVGIHAERVGIRAWKVGIRTTKVGIHFKHTQKLITSFKIIEGKHETRPYAP